MYNSQYKQMPHMPTIVTPMYRYNAKRDLRSTQTSREGCPVEAGHPSHTDGSCIRRARQDPALPLNDRALSPDHAAGAPECARESRHANHRVASPNAEFRRSLAVFAVEFNYTLERM